METGRKFWICVAAFAIIASFALLAVLRMPAQYASTIVTAAVAAISTVALAFMGANAASTVAWSKAETAHTSVSETITREIKARRAAADDNTEETP